MLDQTVDGQAIDGPVDLPEVELPEITEYPFALALQGVAMDSIWVPGNGTEQGIPDSASMVHDQFPRRVAFPDPLFRGEEIRC